MPPELDKVELRTGAPWRDMPERYGKWKTVSGRFYRWRKDGLWQQILSALQQQADTKGQLEVLPVFW